MVAIGKPQNSNYIGRVASLAKKHVSPSKGKVVSTFVRQFFANVPSNDLRGESLHNLTGGVLAIWKALEQRTPGEAKIRVYNPKEATDGWTSSHTVVELINDDMPFLVDSVTAEINRLGAEVRLVIHPIVSLKRSTRGRMTALHTGEPLRGAQRESVMHVQISEQSAEGCKKVAAGLAKVMSDVRAAVEDWRHMRNRAHDLLGELEDDPPELPKAEIEEALDFLRWMDDNHFTYLGYREYRFEGRGAKAVSRIDKASGLGVLRDSRIPVFDTLRNLGQLPPEVRDFVQAPDLLRITKANRRSTVHRAVRMDTIAVKSFDRRGRVVGERLFVGLFTSVAYSRSPSDIPLLRNKVDAVAKQVDFAPGSHDGKALMHILETYPRDELFEISVDDLKDIALGVLHLQERQRTALFLRLDPFERFVSCMVYVPRDRFDTRLRLRLQDLLASSFEGEVATFSTQLTDAALARLHVIIRTGRGRIPSFDHDAIEASLVEASRLWSDFLEEALIRERGEEAGLRCLDRFGRAFPISYQDHFDAEDVVQDIACIEKAIDGAGMAMHLYRPAGKKAPVVHFKIYVAGDPVPLSDILPMLENMGLKVIGEVPYAVEPAGFKGKIWVHDFDMEVQGNAAIDVDSAREAFHDAFARVWNGDMENDGFNRLVLQAGLTARAVIVLRAYCKYLRQARIPFSQSYMETTLARNPRIAALLVDLFRARFDPQEAGPRSGEKPRKAILEQLETVANLDEDRIIRRYLNLIDMTLRTNFYQTAEGGGEKYYCSFKFDSRDIEELPQPRPFREIFVYSPRIEGVHLRFGMVARGGLRWSDRREDFRTEILGLVKAQQVKNAVIVPVGSKGGFVVKNPPPTQAGRDAFLAEGIACYKTFIRGLLDITDNLRGPKVIPPASVVRHDGDDPYLVVAADKGTATFSDIANSVSIEYGHWLDDAFASGGSAGYDHKKMGITARGAWESVKRHFRERGKDIQAQEFTCIGCGDMSGDVFGNGMLLSKHTKLLGAFNHIHIFVDPDPDPAVSWKERARLFNTPGTAWTDYEKKLISAGGGVFDRRAKSIKTTAQMRRIFDIDKPEVTPNELIKAMLLSQVELIWFGGIGTYIKASDETDLDVGDRANDALRINGKQVRAHILGEGANLGATQRGRIEFSLAGGSCNTDSIDNSAGVDCSDHEVNIKILLGAIEQAGGMTRKQRDRLLERMTDEVADQCLRDNYLQSQAITVTHQLGAHLLDRLARFMRMLEKAGRLGRAIENLPDDETIIERTKQEIGMTRPELAVLLSYSKIVHYDELLASDLPDASYFLGDLSTYFPKPLRSKYAEEIKNHRLRREIVSTVVTNDLVNRVGITFVHEVREKTGMSSDEITKAYIIACEIFGIRELWHEIEVLDNKIPALLQSTLLVETGRLLERVAVWLLREEGHPLNIETMIAKYGDGARLVMKNLDALLSQDDLRLLEDRAAAYSQQGVKMDLAQRVASLGFLSPASDIVRIASNAGLPVIDVGRAFFQIGERFGFDWLRRAAGHLTTDTAWDKLAVTAIVDDLYGHQSELTSRMLDGNGSADATESAIDAWSDERRPMVARTEQLLLELRAAGTPDFAMLAVANRQLKSMVAG